MKKYWEMLKKEDIQIKLLAVLSLLLLIGVLLPLFIAGLYSVKSVDDFTYFAGPQAYWQETHSLGGLMLRQVSYAYGIWQNWQGVYFQEWYKTVLMGLCGDKYYFMGSWLAIGSAAGFGFLFVWTVMRKVLLADRSRALIISAACVSMQMLLVQVPQEAFYWFTGSVHYTVTYGLNMLLIAITLYLLTTEKISRGKLLGLEIGVLFLSPAIGGGNFTSGIFTLSLYLLTCILLWWHKHPRKRLITVNFIIYILAFLPCILAPGNRRRLDATSTFQGSVFISILKSLKEAGAYIATWVNLPLIIVGVLLIPIIWNVLDKRDYSYKWPVVVSIVSFGIFASQFAPTLYTLGIAGVGRIFNLYRFTMILWLYGNEIYWLGWIKKQLGGLSDVKIDGSGKVSRILPIWLGGLLVLCYVFIFWGGRTLTTVSAVLSLKNGEAAQFKQEYLERLAVLEDESVKEVYFKPYSVKPYLLYEADIVENPDDWVNTGVANVYDKEFVQLLED